MKITCIKTGGASRNGSYAIVYNFKGWPVGSLKARGWLHAQQMYTREATAQEVQEAQKSKRLLGFRYATWQEVVDDEAKYGIDANALATLEETS